MKVSHSRREPAPVDARNLCSRSRLVRIAACLGFPDLTASRRGLSTTQTRDTRPRCAPEGTAPPRGRNSSPAEAGDESSIRATRGTATSAVSTTVRPRGTDKCSTSEAASDRQATSPPSRKNAAQPPGASQRPGACVATRRRCPRGSAVVRKPPARFGPRARGSRRPGPGAAGAAAVEADAPVVVESPGHLDRRLDLPHERPGEDRVHGAGGHVDQRRGARTPRAVSGTRSRRSSHAPRGEDLGRARRRPRPAPRPSATQASSFAPTPAHSSGCTWTDRCSFASSTFTSSGNAAPYTSARRPPPQGPAVDDGAHASIVADLPRLADRAVGQVVATEHGREPATAPGLGDVVRAGRRNGGTGRRAAYFTPVRRGARLAARRRQRRPSAARASAAPPRRDRLVLARRARRPPRA